MIYIIGKIGAGKKTASTIVERNFPNVKIGFPNISVDIEELADNKNKGKKFYIMEIESKRLSRFCRKRKQKEVSFKDFTTVDSYNSDEFKMLRFSRDFVVKNDDTLENFEIELVSTIKKILGKGV